MELSNGICGAPCFARIARAVCHIAWEVDHRGWCVVAVGPLDMAEKVAETIRTIGIEVQVNPLRLWGGS